MGRAACKDGDEVTIANLIAALMEDGNNPPVFDDDTRIKRDQIEEIFMRFVRNKQL